MVRRRFYSCSLCSETVALWERRFAKTSRLYCRTSKRCGFPLCRFRDKCDNWHEPTKYVGTLRNNYWTL